MQKIVALYLRVSTTEQAISGLGLEDQRTRSAAYAQALGLEGEVRVFVDAGESAGTLDRPALAELRRLIARKQVACIVALKLDRLTRRLRDLLALVDECAKAGTALHAVSERIDTSSAAGRMMLAVLGAAAEWERESIAERTRSAVRVKRARGEAHGFARLGEQDVAGRLEAVADEVATVARIHELRGAGMSLRQIAAELTRTGARTKRGGAWRASTIAAVLER